MRTSAKKFLIFLAITNAALFIVLLLTVRFNITGHFEGFFLLRDKSSGKYEFADHLYVGEGSRLVYGVNLTTLQYQFINSFLPAHKETTVHLHCDWNPHDGSGMVSNHLADGTRLVTYFGRYLDDDEEVHGLFVGGGLPETVSQSSNYNLNRSGMTYNYGQRWYHIWCSVNEGIGTVDGKVMLTPSHWKFLGSRVVRRSDREVVLSSSHSVVIDNLPVRIDRRVSFTAGETWFNLEITITNVGNEALTYRYAYGDEPWVGYYGTALGDVGWVQDRLVNFEELLDGARYSHAGMVDSGNRVIGERPVYTNLANFIEWFGDEQPLVYFANKGGQPPLPGTRVPLESNERYIALEWARALPPGESAVIRLAIGMAMFDPRAGVPVKPATSWK